MNKKISLGTAIALMLIMIAATFSITMVYSSGIFSDKMHDIKERESLYAKLSEIDSIVRTNYLNEIDNERLMDQVAAGYVGGLSDRYGAYLTSEEYANVVQDIDGRMVSIGIKPVQDGSGYILISEVFDGSPALDAGLKVGDLIIKVDDTDVKEETYEDCTEAMKGEPGTQVTLMVRRDAQDFPLEITRRNVEIPTVVYRKIDDYGYINIKAFDNYTFNQFTKALDNLLAENVTGIIFDVRNNLGGTINAVSSVLDRLLPEGPIVSATYRDGTTELLKSSDEIELNLPMVVLANSKSASAAELFAQALKDYGKAKVVGNTTFGKGLMQTIYQLNDGSALEITVAKYNPPKSPNFDGVGVKPDFDVSLAPETEKDFASLTDEADTQLKKALEVLNGAVKIESLTPAEEPTSSSEPESSSSEEEESQSSSSSEKEEPEDSSSEDTSSEESSSSSEE